MTFSQGHANLGSIRGAPIRVHWSVPIGAVVFCGFKLVPGGWLAFLLLIVPRHEPLATRSSSAASASRSCRSTSTRSAGSAAGTATRSPWQRSVIAWGGVVGQLVVLAIALVLGFVDSPYLQGDFVRQMLHAFVATNLSLMAVNLVPVRPLDGAEAWLLFGMLWRRRVAAWKRRREIAARKRPSHAPRRGRGDDRGPRHLDALDEEEPPPIPREVEAVL